MPSATAASAARLWSIDVHLGIGGPRGILVLTRELVVSKYIGAHASAGLLPRVSFMPYVHMNLSRRTQIGTSVGSSAGMDGWGEGPFCFADECASKRAWLSVRGNIEVWFQWRSARGWQLRPYIGFSVLANPGSMECVGSAEAIAHCRSDHADDGIDYPYGGLAIGKAW